MLKLENRSAFSMKVSQSVILLKQTLGEHIEDGKMHTLENHAVMQGGSQGRSQWRLGFPAPQPPCPAQELCVSHLSQAAAEPLYGMALTPPPTSAAPWQPTPPIFVSTMYHGASCAMSRRAPWVERTTVNGQLLAQSEEFE